MSVPMLDVNRQNRPLLGEIEHALFDICENGAFVHGPAVKQLETEIAKYCQVDHAVACASGSDALLLPLMALDIAHGDEVILPSFTFFATAGAVSRLGATPVFADIVPGTYNIDPADIERKITPRTKAIMPVHLFGQACDMGRIMDLATRYNLPVIEDCAQAIGAEYKGQRVGSFGAFGGFSFYPTKNLGGFGDGGIITCLTAEHAEQLRILRDHGQYPRYVHHVVGLNSRLDTLQAAVLCIKLKQLDRYAAGRTKNAVRYASRFRQLGLEGVVDLPEVAANCGTVWNQFTVRVRSGRRDALQKFLGDRKIGSAIYYPIPLHLQDCFADLEYREGDLPHTEQAAKEVLSLPIFAELTSEEQEAVIDSVAAFCYEATRREPVRRAA